VQFLGEIAAIASAVTWAAANAALKSTIATVFCGLTLLALEQTIWPALDRRATIYLAVSAIIGITFGDVSYFAALVRLGARRAVFLGTLVPPASALVAYFAFGETLSLLQILGMILTLGGVTLVLYESTADRSTTKPERYVSGLIFGLIAIVFQVAANILTKKGAGTHSALAVSTVRLLIGSTGLLIWAVLARRTREVFRPLGAKKSATLILVATVLGSYFGVWFYMAAIMYTEVGIAVTLSATSPIFITILAHFFLGERATLRPFMGAAVSVAGVALLFLGG
jgi:drug/metabolite transporter (DMT)-like permease